MKKRKRDASAVARRAILVLADVKSAVEAFDAGEIGVFDALDAIEVAVEAYRTAAETRRNAA